MARLLQSLGRLSGQIARNEMYVLANPGAHLAAIIGTLDEQLAQAEHPASVH